ncbi:DUF1311 domain-containing protein [Pantoea dispersa]|uniref:lysozyme inhibitor LprI family protein n=1 Tax=Pantoea dispersa TaxID=59814 RepID=UPI000F65A8A3|nr:lysozyme inhibitor LprI family protein [Pantoea dispersa]RRW69712.1 DUF1311 domain-containing protein [Pantoea dispersa]
MKLMKLIAAFIALTCTLNAHAGFFSSPDGFKCGREDAVKTISNYYRNDALGLLQRDYITKTEFSYDKPIAAYQNKLNDLVVVASNVTTYDDSYYGLKCSATISVKVPQEALDVMTSVPKYLLFVTGNYSRLNNGNVVWSDVSYNVKLADNGKDVIFNPIDNISLSKALFNISVLSVDKDQIINANSKDTLNSAKSEYKTSDRDLNSVWRDLPDSSRNALKKEQLAWVNTKVDKCGKLSDAESDNVDMKQRIEIYQCQAKMTRERIDFLGGTI